MGKRLWATIDDEESAKKAIREAAEAAGTLAVFFACGAAYGFWKKDIELGGGAPLLALGYGFLWWRIRKESAKLTDWLPYLFPFTLWVVLHSATYKTFVASDPLEVLMLLTILVLPLAAAILNGVRGGSYLESLHSKWLAQKRPNDGTAPEPSAQSV